MSYTSNQVNLTFQEQYGVCGGTTYGVGNPHHYTLSEYTPKVFVEVRIRFNNSNFNKNLRCTQTRCNGEDTIQNTKDLTILTSTSILTITPCLSTPKVFVEVRS
jgi:hypothetical protein